MSLFEKLRGFVQARRESQEASYSEPVDDWETRDKSLRALRRLKRRQLDELERSALSKSIAAHNEAREKAYFNDSSVLGSGGNLKVRRVSSGHLFSDDFGFMGGGRKKMRK